MIRKMDLCCITNRETEEGDDIVLFNSRNSIEETMDFYKKYILKIKN